jgi:hypothetical protein
LKIVVFTFVPLLFDLAFFPAGLMDFLFPAFIVGDELSAGASFLFRGLTPPDSSINFFLANLAAILESLGI